MCGAYPACVWKTIAHLCIDAGLWFTHMVPGLWWINLMILYFTMMWKQYSFHRKHPSNFDFWSFPELVICSGEADGNPLQYSCLENPMDGGAWWATVHGVAKSWTQLSDFTFTFHFHALEKEMATHSSVLAWRIPGTVEPGGLPSMGSHRVGHDWSDLAAAAAFKSSLRRPCMVYL